ncbi:hypothetical protein [Natrinema saccharevitans]|nr:hypothetical protein [Natrinema saccharevitans]
MTDDTRGDDDEIEFEEADGPESDDSADPLGDLASAVAESAGDEPDAETAAFDDLFDRQDTAEIDADRLWAELEGDDLPASTDASEVREVDKRAYCQGCDYLAEPPDVACTHADAEILAVPTIETVRVADCPFVLADEADDRER